MVDPVHGKDVGYFVFTLPFELLVSSGLLLWLVAVTAAFVTLVNVVRGRVGWRPLRGPRFEAQVHLAALVAAVPAGRPPGGFDWSGTSWSWNSRRRTTDDAFAGADYVDVHVRLAGTRLC